MPRILKSRDTQTARSREMAEVFTPSWICNAQNNLIDEAWFGRKDVFNTEYTDEQGCHRWRPSSKKIQFPEGKTWKDYVRDNRLEITCGKPLISSVAMTPQRERPFLLRNALVCLTVSCG